MASLWTEQPGKTIWSLFAGIVVVCQLPFLFLYYTPSILRPHPSWTVFQSVMNSLMRSFLYHTAVVQVSTPLRLDAGYEKERFVTIQPSTANIYGNIAEDSQIKPATTGGTWYPTPYVPGDGGLVVLHFHGGGYAIGEGRPGDAAFAGQMLSEKIPSKALFLSYRLASNPGGRFPAALQDALTAYAYLCTLVEPSRIVISGDSAGGHLAISLLRYLSLNSNTFVAPLAMLLWSPAIDLIAARDPSITDGNRNYKTDYLVGNFTAWGARRFTGDVLSSRPEALPYINPLGHQFATKTPIWVCLGGMEILHDEGKAWASEMQQVRGNKVEVFTQPLANHDVIFVGNITGFRQEAETAATRAGKFVKGCQKVD